VGFVATCSSSTRYRRSSTASCRGGVLELYLPWRRSPALVLLALAGSRTTSGARNPGPIPSATETKRLGGRTKRMRDRSARTSLNIGDHHRHVSGYGRRARQHRVPNLRCRLSTATGHPGRARRINLASGHRWSCASDFHQSSTSAIRLTGPGVQRATNSKPSAARPLANIVHLPNEPAFTLENRIYRWQQLVEHFCLYDVTCCP
jgi:hypothetical protein